MDGNCKPVAMIQTKTEAFREFVRSETDIAKEKGLMEKWELYEHLKSFIPAFNVEYETAIKIITGTADL